MQIEVHLEDYYHAITLPERWSDYDAALIKPTQQLLELFARHQQKATFYVLGAIAETDPFLIQEIHHQGHAIGNHGYWHRHNEREGDASYHKAAHAIFTALKAKVSGPYPYRSPYWDTTPRPGYCGGAYLRHFSLWWLKRELKRTGVLWIHPHDVMQTAYHGEPWQRRAHRWDGLERLDYLLTECR